MFKPYQSHPFQFSHYFGADDPYLEIADFLRGAMQAEGRSLNGEAGNLEDLAESVIRRWFTLLGVEDIDAAIERVRSAFTSAICSGVQS